MGNSHFWNDGYDQRPMPQWLAGQVNRARKHLDVVRAKYIEAGKKALAAGRKHPPRWAQAELRAAEIDLGLAQGRAAEVNR